MKSQIELEIEQNKFNKDFKKAQFKSILLGIQIALVVPLTVLFVVSFFKPEMLLAAKINLIFVMLIMVYNNNTYFKRKYGKLNASFAYIAIALWFLIDIIIGLV